MIVGSGLIARAFASRETSLDATCVYAAGVSNSGCSDASEFARERERIAATLAATPAATRFVYFSTCSIDDPWSVGSAYVAHKAAMEMLVRGHDNHLIVRLPQIAGRTANPHTLLNHLYARICRSERFNLWRDAHRNIIDVDDAVAITVDLIVTEGVRAETLNVANPRNFSIGEIVVAFERVTSHRAIYNVVERGGPFAIAVDRIAASIQRCNIAFDDEYLHRTLAKYYG